MTRYLLLFTLAASFASGQAPDIVPDCYCNHQTPQRCFQYVPHGNTEGLGGYREVKGCEVQKHKSAGKPDLVVPKKLLTPEGTQDVTGVDDGVAHWQAQTPAADKLKISNENTLELCPECHAWGDSKTKTECDEAGCKTKPMAVPECTTPLCITFDENGNPILPAQVSICDQLPETQRLTCQMNMLAPETYAIPEGPGIGDLVQPPADDRGWSGAPPQVLHGVMGDPGQTPDAMEPRPRATPDPIKTAQEGYDCVKTETPKTITISCTKK